MIVLVYLIDNNMCPYNTHTLAILFISIHIKPQSSIMTTNVSVHMRIIYLVGLHMYIPHFVSLLLLHVVITCQQPPHVHCSMPPSVHSIHSVRR